MANAAARGRSLTAPADLELELEQLLSHVEETGLPLTTEQAATEHSLVSSSLWGLGGVSAAGARLQPASMLSTSASASMRGLHTAALNSAHAADPGGIGFPTTAGTGSSVEVNANPNVNMLNPELDNAAFAAAAARTAAKQAFDPERGAAAGMPLSTQVPDGHGGLAGSIGEASPHVPPYQHQQHQQLQQHYAGAHQRPHSGAGHPVGLGDDGSNAGGTGSAGSSLRGIASAVGSAAAVGANIMQLGATVAGSMAESVASAGANVVREGLRTAAMPLQGAAAALDAAARSLQAQGGSLHGGGASGHQGQQGERVMQLRDDGRSGHVQAGHHDAASDSHYLRDSESAHHGTYGAQGRNADAYRSDMRHHDHVHDALHDVSGASIGAANRPAPASAPAASFVSAGGHAGTTSSRFPASGLGLHDPHSRLFSTQAQAQASQRMRGVRARAATLPSTLPSASLLRSLHSASTTAAAAAGGAGQPAGRGSSSSASGGIVTERDAHAASGADYSGVAALSSDDAQTEVRAYAAGQRQRVGESSAGMRVAGIRAGQQPDAVDTTQPGVAGTEAAAGTGTGSDSAQLTEAQHGDVSDAMATQAVTSEAPSTAERSRRMAQESSPGPAGADALARGRKSQPEDKPSRMQAAAAEAKASDAQAKRTAASQDMYQGGFGGALQPPPVSQRESGGVSSSDMESTPLIYGAPKGGPKSRSSGSAYKSAPSRSSSGPGPGRDQGKDGISLDGPSGSSRRSLHTASVAGIAARKGPADDELDIDTRGGSLVGAHTMASISDLQTIGGERHGD